MRPGRRSPLSSGRAAMLWRGVRARRRTATTARGLLRPGVYCLRSDVLWARRGAGIPVHLRRTKGGSPPGTARVSRPYRLLCLIAGTFLVLDPRMRGTADLVVASFDGGVVVLDQPRGRVHRSYGTGRLTPAEVQRRQVFTQHVSAPQFWVLEGGAAVEEELVDGAHLGDLTAQERGEVVTTLVEQFAALTAAHTGEPAPLTDRDLEQLLQDAQVPSGFAHAWANAETEWFPPSAPWIPSPREANAKNLVVRPDGRPAPIDLGDLQVDPCFIYPVGILIATGDETMRRFLSGAADYSIPLLVATAGRRWSGTPSQRRGLLLARIVYAAFKDASVDGVSDRGVFEASLSRRWDEVRAVFAESAEPGERARGRRARLG